MGTKLIIFGLFPIFGGLVVFLLAYHSVQKARSFRDWPTANGTIESSEIIQSTIARLRVPSYRSATEPYYRQDPVWEIVVSYHYDVDGKRLSGSEATSFFLVENINRRHPREPSMRMKALFAQLQPGAATIHYNPQNPEESYVIYIDAPTVPHDVRVGILCVIFGLGFVLAGFFIKGRTPRTLPDAAKQRIETYLNDRRP